LASSKLTLSFINKLVTEKYIDFLLFNQTSNAYYFYDEEFLGTSSLLTVQKFKHSTSFEFV